jgi:hypothetical protein
MRRLGQSTVQASLIYQHAMDDRDGHIAKSVGDRIKDEVRRAEEKRKEDERKRAEGGAAG